MRTDDPNSYITGTYGDDWAFGKEAWCNMQGRYTTIVADYSHIMDSYSEITPSICDFAVFGTRYIRDGSVPEQFELFAGES